MHAPGSHKTPHHLFICSALPDIVASGLLLLVYSQDMVYWFTSIVPWSTQLVVVDRRRRSFVIPGIIIITTTTTIVVGGLVVPKGSSRLVPSSLCEISC